MEREELLTALRRMAVETGSLVCLGCGHEHRCSLHGCAVIRAAQEEIMQLAVEHEAMRLKLSPEDAEACRRPMTQAERDGILEWPPRQPFNPPLTLEELREMDGEPVWVVHINGVLRPFWMLVDAEDESVANRLYVGMFEDYGEEWLAYRRKPEEGTM